MAQQPRVAMTLTQDWHSVPGGTAVAANAVAAALARTDEVTVVGVVPAGPTPQAPWTPPVPTASLRLRLPFLYDAWHTVRRPRVTTASGAVDLVHLTVPIACPPERVPVVATVHDVLPLTMPEMFSRRGVRLMSRGLARIRDEAAIVMVPSEHGRAEFVAAGFDEGRVHVVPLGVTPREPADPSAVAAAMRRHGVEEPYVLFVGTAEPRKGLDVLLAALDLLDRSELTLALVGPEGWGKVLQGGGRTKVRRLGFVEADDLAMLQAGAAVCCLPSIAEGFGLPVLEAMAAGAPVVTTSGTPMEEVAGDAALCVSPGDPPALAAALADVLDDEDLAARLRAAGPVRAAGFSWDRTAAGVLDVYREVLDR